MKEKRKFHQRPFGRYIFLVLWILANCILIILPNALWGIFTTIVPIEAWQMPLTTITLNVINTLIVMSVVGIVQQVVIYQYWQYRIKHWWWVTAMGATVVNFFGVITLQIVASNSEPDGQILLTLFIGLLGVITAILQAILLSRYFQRTWWYVVMVGLTGLFIAIFIPPNIVITPIILGLVTGITLLWLESQTVKKKLAEEA